MNRRVARWIALLLCSCVLCACGGDGGGFGELNPDDQPDDGLSDSPDEDSGGDSGAPRLTLGGTVSGLEGTLDLLLVLPDTEETLTVSGSGGTVPFEFEARVQAGQTYDIRVANQPAGQECRVANGFGEVVDKNISDIAVNCVMTDATASLSGTVIGAANIDADSDLNDPRANFADNSTPSQAQPIFNRATLHGFASAQPTDGSSRLENFANEADRDDFFRVSLHEGQVIQLQVVDFEGFRLDDTFAGDLDLVLYRESGELAGVSDGQEEFEEIVVPESGRYYVNVHAHSGISKYVLRLAPAAGDIAGEGGAAVELVPGEVILRTDQSSLQAKSSVLAGLDFQQYNRDRASLVSLTNSGGPAVLSASSTPDAAMEEIRAMAPESHARVETLRKIKTLRQQPGVLYAEPNYIRRASRVPNDPAYEYQWHYSAIDLPLAWDLATGLAPQAPVTVAVIDTGVVLSHPDLAPRLVKGYDFVSNADSARDGTGIDPDPDDPGDQPERGQSSWHGTHVAGTIAAASDNGSGVAGASWGARLMPVRVLGAGGATSYDLIQALRYVAGLSNDSGTVPENPADIANLSLGGPQGSLAEQEAVSAVREAGVVIIAAAGNEGSSSPSYPAAYDGVISVSATGYTLQLAPYSNYGNSIDVAAPGGNLTTDINGDGYPDGVLSTLADDTSGEREPVYGFYHGTSMAAPHVAGVVALMEAVYPDLTPDDVDRLLSSGRITADLGKEGRDALYGYGLIDAHAAVQQAAEVAGGEPLPEAPAQVVAVPDSLNLGLADEALVRLANAGGGEPSVASITTEDPWLTVTPVDTGQAGLGDYRVSVQRADLPAGLYQSEILVSIDNGNELHVPVAMQVGETLRDSTLTQIYVLLLRHDTDEVVDVVEAEPLADRAAYTYRFEEVPVGRYEIVAGSDIDVDSYVCQSGEACGAYPTLANRQPVQVDGVDQTGLDFVGNILGAFPSTEGALVGAGEGADGTPGLELQMWRRLPRELDTQKE